VRWELLLENRAAVVFLTRRARGRLGASNLGLDGRPIKIDWSVAWLTWWWRGYCIIHVRPTTHQLSSCQSISADSTARRGVQRAAPTKFHIHPVDRTMSIFNSSKAHHLMRQNNCVFGARGGGVLMQRYFGRGSYILRHTFSNIESKSSKNSWNYQALSHNITSHYYLFTISKRACVSFWSLQAVY
jgi:hypothetical protein